MKEISRPFDSIEPLVDYLVSLEQVTQDPTDMDARARLQQTDAVLTEKAVLFPERTYVHDEGYRVYGYKSCTVSDGVEHLAQYHEPGAVIPEGQEFLRDPEALRRQSRGAIISLGEHIAVSDAFHTNYVGDAYEALDESLKVLGMPDADPEKFAAFGRHRIGRDLLSSYVKLHTHPTTEFPIAKSTAKANIDEAWGVMGRPFGVWTKAVAHLIGGTRW
jgi:hypothetical protein